ncbi:transglycosylase family protein [Streptomyces sp. NPDC005551]|uniref:transglycosylase family protein n=1 Tax=unclassified Streptomyces TaxID=2593676 RepID=UPI0033FEB238
MLASSIKRIRYAAAAAAALAVLLPSRATAAPPPFPGPPFPGSTLPGSQGGLYDCAAKDWPWGCLAECESSGRWHANTGNGFYGGLQFRQSTWKEFGGLAYAPRADLATRKQQIKVAREVLATQGWGAWPYCSKKYGLAGRVHVVKSGETLSSIARKYGVKGGKAALQKANELMLGPHPGRLNPGTMLVIPQGSATTRHADRELFGPPLAPPAPAPSSVPSLPAPAALMQGAEQGFPDSPTDRATVREQHGKGTQPLDEPPGLTMR